ncbi:MAG: sigma-54-dependent Fis family transcriptional regulator [Acidobacteria bacterium]|nr:sigma-54-dependent Fis family transcriptional regulator [Acidobacteriota bacterium]
MMKHRILVVDDEPNQRTVLAGFLGKHGYDILTAESAEKALTVCSATPPDLIISDMKMTGKSGRELLAEIRRADPLIPFIMITAYGNVDEAVAIMKEGATDYLGKPVNLSELLLKIAKALEQKMLLEENEELRRELVDSQMTESIRTRNPRMREVLSMAARAARADVPILILGESGTGKELLARTIHSLSAVKGGPFVPVNCASLNPGVLESELFGHERGAFTGAATTRKGRFEIAQNGSLFLDEVGDIPPEIQVKLLRVLQENEIERVGGNQSIPVRFRLISATNRDLEELIQAGGFREDLFYRINVVSLRLPPLRQRREDIPVLMDHFLGYYSEKYGIEMKGFSREARQRLLAYDYPGNIRELMNVIQRSLVLARGDVIQTVQFDQGACAEAAGDTVSTDVPGGTLPEAVESLEKRMIMQALEENDHVQVRAARQLGISERNIRYKMEKYGLKAEE